MMENSTAQSVQRPLTPFIFEKTTNIAAKNHLDQPEVRTEKTKYA